jgi:tetratricopeptide (TPR) repeat protein
MSWTRRWRAWRTRSERAGLEDEIAAALARGDADQAASTARRCVGLLTQIDPEHPDLPVARYALAAALLAAGDAEGADREGQRALAALPTPPPADLPRVLLLELLASAAEKQAESTALEQRLRALVEEAERQPHGAPRDLAIATASTRLGLALARAGRADDAWPHLARAAALRKSRLPPGDLQRAEALHNAATHRLGGAPLEEAAARFEEAIAAAAAAGDRGRELEETALHNLGALREEQGRDDDARRAWESALERRQARLGHDHPSLRATLVRLAQLRQRTGSTLQAGVLLERAHRLARAELGDDHDIVRALGHLRRDALGGGEDR